MPDVTHPHHSHERHVWVVPDSSLGRAASMVFATAAGVALAAPLAAWLAQQLLQPGADTWWFFLLWGCTLVALLVVTATAVAAAVALVRDHAVLLLAPIVVGAIGVMALLSDGLLA